MYIATLLPHWYMIDIVALVFATSIERDVGLITKRRYYNTLFNGKEERQQAEKPDKRLAYKMRRQ